MCRGNKIRTSHSTDEVSCHLHFQQPRATTLRLARRRRPTTLFQTSHTTWVEAGAGCLLLCLFMSATNLRPEIPLAPTPTHEQDLRQYVDLHCRFLYPAERKSRRRLVMRRLSQCRKLSRSPPHHNFSVPIVAAVLCARLVHSPLPLEKYAACMRAWIFHVAGSRLQEDGRYRG